MENNPLGTLAGKGLLIAPKGIEIKFCAVKFVFAKAFNRTKRN